ncbi:NAD(P)/FAD-dependent oxidoreductase [Halobacteriovorax sp. HLS]|uniref:phytoene desaturase family protein n=1 Tax=Halobacteriovorax sp. HLS TaxID=2234000 RepID=UPI000FDB6E66|nr:NAD(P)/FAD-dependent oxidoreductase [Halobacteriovorax sp. HLS]
MKNYDAVIIGAGISGLTSSILLAREGMSVAIVEKHSRVGGYLHSFKRFGIEFDTGGHYIGAMEKGGAFRTLLEYLNVYVPEHYRPMAQSKFDRFVIKGKEYSFSQGYDKCIKDLTEHFPHESEGIKQYFEKLLYVAKLMPSSNFKLNERTTEVFKWMETSLKDTVESYIEDSQLQDVLYSYCTLHGVSPKDVAFAPHAVITDTLIQGPYTFQNSGDDLAKSFKEECSKLGVDFFLGEELLEMNVIDSEIKKLKTTSFEFCCKYVISSMHPKMTFARLDHDPTRRVFKDRLLKMKESKSFVAAYIRLKSKTKFDPDTNYYFFKKNISNLFDDANPLDPNFLYLCRPGRSNEENYNLKHSFITVHIPCDYSYVSGWKDSTFGKRSESYKAFKEKLKEVIKIELIKIDDSFKTNIDKIEISTPLTNIHYNGSLEGSAYGIYHSISNTGLKGLSPKTKIKNLFLTGQNISFPGLQSSCSAGVRSVSALLRTEKFDEDLRRMSSQNRKNDD